LYWLVTHPHAWTIRIAAAIASDNLIKPQSGSAQSCTDYPACDLVSAADGSGSFVHHGKLISEIARGKLLNDYSNRRFQQLSKRV